MRINWPAFVQIVNNNQRFILTSHIRPDCDALGSVLGMALILDKLDKHVRIVNGQAVPPNLAFIDPDKRIETLGEGIQPEDLVAADVHMVLDTSAWAQLGPMGEVLHNTKARKIILDHHVSEDDLGGRKLQEHFRRGYGTTGCRGRGCFGCRVDARNGYPPLRSDRHRYGLVPISSDNLIHLSNCRSPDCRGGRAQ